MHTKKAVSRLYVCVCMCTCTWNLYFKNYTATLNYWGISIITLLWQMPKRQQWTSETFCESLLQTPHLLRLHGCFYVSPLGETTAAAAAAAAAGHLLRLSCVLLWFVWGDHVSCYNNPNRLTGWAEAVAGGGGPTTGQQAARKPIRSLGWAAGRSGLKLLLLFNHPGRARSPEAGQEIKKRTENMAQKPEKKPVHVLI